MMTHRGLTLIEVLAATVLLVMVTAVCLPLYRRAIVVLSVDEASSVARAEFVGLVEAVMADPSAFGIEDLSAIDSAGIPWPENPERIGVTVTRLERNVGGSADETAEHCWLRFTCESHAAHRWLKLDPPEDEVAP